MCYIKRDKISKITGKNFPIDCLLVLDILFIKYENKKKQKKIKKENETIWYARRHQQSDNK